MMKAGAMTRTRESADPRMMLTVEITSANIVTRRILAIPRSTLI